MLLLRSRCRLDSGFNVGQSAMLTQPWHAGAAAGAAAVLASMPADCVKTVLEMETAVASRGPLADAGHFAATGRAMLERGGPGALFIGMGPRLAETVGGFMMHCMFSILQM